VSDTEPVPKTQYTRLGDDRIAYQVFGDGEIDFLQVTSLGLCVDLLWDYAPYANALRWLGERTRVILFDGRGAGASDAPSGDTLPGWEQWADEALVVLDAVGSERAVISNGGPDSGATSILFAASHPERTSALLTFNAIAYVPTTADDPLGMKGGFQTQVSSELVADTWGTEELAEWIMPEVAKAEPHFARWYARMQRLCMSPTEAGRLLSYQPGSMDVRDALPLVQVPTLLIHDENHTIAPSSHGRFLAEHIAGARLVLIHGNGGLYFTDPSIRSTVEDFLNGLGATAAPDRALAAVLFTDIVGSTAKASALGDREWRNLLNTHDAVARTVVSQHRGRVVKTTGDGVLATFDGPGRAIRCAIALGEALRPLGIEIRAGLHTGEVEVRGDDIAGIGVHIAARVLEAAKPGDLVVSPAVPMLVAGAGFEFEDRGDHELKGVPGNWNLFAVKS
jgi:class 3 adenylate cyclase/pimeloyl-ACP methyl ester carboxylesterase